MAGFLRGSPSGGLLQRPRAFALPRTAGFRLPALVASVKSVAEIVAEITSAGREQSSGIGQVSKAVLQLEELTQQNSALVEEASAATQSMAEQARHLNGSMQRYKVDPRLMAQAAAAAKPSAEQVAAATVPVRERRKAGRPWTVPAAVNAGAVPAGDDTIWKEF